MAARQASMSAAIEGSNPSSVLSRCSPRTSALPLFQRKDPTGIRLAPSLHPTALRTPPSGGAAYRGARVPTHEA